MFFSVEFDMVDVVAGGRNDGRVPLPRRGGVHADRAGRLVQRQAQPDLAAQHRRR